MKNKSLIIIKVITILLIILFITNGTTKAIQINIEHKGLETQTRYSGMDFDALKDIYGDTDGSLKTMGEKILGIVSFLCYAAAIIILAYKGVQFMNKAPEAKAELKKELVHAVIGAILLAGAGAIVQIISNIAIGPLFGG